MKLSSIMLNVGRSLPKGHLFRGKYRLVKKVTPLLLAKKRYELELQERNMFYLRHPYLTPEQNFNHAKAFNHHQKFIDKHNEERAKNWRDHKALGDRFGYLKITDCWE